MKKAPTPRKEASANTQRNHTKKHNLTPRQLRALAALSNGPQTVRALQQAAGCNNAPEIIGQLRRRGFKIPCAELRGVDRDGRRCLFGQYKLTIEDRLKVNEALGI